MKHALLTLLILTTIAWGQERPAPRRWTPELRKKYESYEDAHDPWRPGWLQNARVRFQSFSELAPRKPFPLVPVTPTPGTEDRLPNHALLLHQDSDTVFVYHRGTGRLSAVAEIRRGKEGAVLSRWVRYHPLFGTQTVAEFRTVEGRGTQLDSLKLESRETFLGSDPTRLSGTGPFQFVASFNNPSWSRDDLLAATLQVLDIPLGQIPGEPDSRTFGVVPYTPAWLEHESLASWTSLEGGLPFKNYALRDGTPEGTEFRVATEHQTVFAFDRKSRRLTHVLERQAGDDVTTRARLVWYHPTFTWYGRHDFARVAGAPPSHRLSAIFRRETFAESPQNRTAVEASGPFVTAMEWADGTATLDAVGTYLLRWVPEG